MSLAPGTRIGPYEVVSLLGEGGMGQVYRARDSKLDRDVAIKILPEQFAADAERVARFEREAKTLAALNHPHIAQIYGFEQSAGTSGLVMELVGGEDLSERISRGPVPPDEALAIARQIVDALDAAHGHGIIHRDLKPANIKIKEDGTVKVLDFGLAKAIDPVAAGSSSGATITSPAMTMAGVILGTAAYMAPEQAKGRPVDKRVDIWAFGCIVYEMVAGQRAFPGEDVSESIASVLKTEPDYSKVPSSLKPLLVKCLQKDPRNRLRDIGDVALLLDRAHADAPVAPPSMPIAVKAIATAAIVALVASGVMIWRARSTDAGTNLSAVRLTLRFPQNSPLQLGSNQPSMAISPDGKTIIYSALGPEGTQLWAHSLDSFDPRPLAGTGGGARNAFFSPDGRQIAFFVGNQLKRIPMGGGTATVLCEAMFPYGGTWTERDEVIFMASGFGGKDAEPGLWRVAAGGGEKRPIVAGIFSYPDVLPGGRIVVASADTPAARTTSELNIVTVDLDSGDVRPLIAGGAYPRYAKTGHLLFLRNGAIVAAAIDVAARTASDQSMAVIPDVFMNPAVASGNFAVSAAGTLAYAPATAANFNRSLVLIDAKGERTAVTDERRFFEWPRVSPDGQRIAVSIPGWHDTIWLFDRGRGALTELTASDTNGVTPVWTPDGKRIVFASYPANGNGPRNLYWMTADGSGAAERLSTSQNLERPNAWTPDGQTLLYDARTATGTDLWTLTLDSKRTTRPLIATRANEMNAALSPNGQWMAFSSDQSGRPEIYLTRLVAPKPSSEGGPSVDGRIQVSTAGGRNAVWSPDGRRLYYRSLEGDEIMAVDVTGTGSPVLSRPTAIARLPRVQVTRGHFDVMPDGRLLVVDDESAGGTTDELRVVVNWFDELKRKMSGGQQR